jgi:hypothetical protein
MTWVNPTGEFESSIGPFSYCGNRGPIDDGSVITKTHAHQHWIYCSISALRTPSDFMRAGTYTDLLFLDEATALSAGHRPCGKCNRRRLNEFLSAWSAVNKGFSGKPKDVDKKLKDERLESRGARSNLIRAKDLPDGTMIRLLGSPHLLANKMAYPWSPDGYNIPIERPTDPVETLTPPSIVKLFKSGKFKIDTKNLILSW